MTALSNLRRIEVADILEKLPDIKPLDVRRHMVGKKEELFLAALGFEDRCPWISELLAEEQKYRVTRAIYFEYETNQNDNDMNRPRLVNALESLTTQVRSMPCDSNEFASQLREILSEVCSTGSNLPMVTFDISVCSSRLLITVLTVLLEFDISLRVVYSEAGLYHPTKKEYDAHPDKWTSDDKLGLARGVSTVTRSPDHPGSRRDVLPEAAIVFPTFKPERIRAILADIDESLLMKPKKRVVWLIGEPHLPEDHWRTDVQQRINDIPASAPVYKVSTFDYKKTLEILERVYQPIDCKYLVNIAPLGSKMQSLGVVLFWYIHPEVSIYFASPREYNAVQYSEGCKATWRVEFGDVNGIRKFLRSVGELRIQNDIVP
ncbi:MAG: hypothetical protein JRJ66_13785 [Deltaproteobacteria bacterium]|nr:hypothetical protein [Deltaproteobacteria bacterium]MBW1976002.1 hypothetical protein [Deltaproteobacteria bacterium]